MRVPLLAISVWLVMAGNPATAASKPGTALPGIQVDGSVLLPNQWSLRPVGSQISVGDFPSNIALHPDGVFAAVLHSGWGLHEVRIIDLKAGRVVSQAMLDECYYGLAWSPDGRSLFTSGASAEVIHAFAFEGGKLSAARDLRLRPENERGIPAGLASSSDGKALYVAESWGQCIRKISTADGHTLWLHQFKDVPTGKRGEADQARVEPDGTGNSPFPYTCLADEKHGRIFVSLWGASAVLVLDAKTGTQLATWPVGPHPNEMVLGKDGRLFVAEANLNTVSVIDSASGRVLEQLTAALFPHSPPGSMPNSVALSKDGKLLFVANANNNNVAIFDVKDRRHAESLGFIPVGWFPTSVRVTNDGRTLVVANGKGGSSAPNPHGPGTKTPKNLEEYIGKLFPGTVTLIDLPSAKKRGEQFGAWSKIAYTCSPLDPEFAPRGGRPVGNPIPAKVGDVSPIKHVIYIIRENRTYDQVLGDLSIGNGDPRLCLFPERVTPNAHALAREFVLLDNLYADGEVSADGHEWSMGAVATDFVEKQWPLGYGHDHRNKYDYPSEGRYPIAYPANGYLWNRAAEAGVSFRSYGEFCNTPENGPILSEASLPILVGHVDPLFKAWDLDYPDVQRVDRFIAEMKRFEVDGDMPRLQVMHLGGDHTYGSGVGHLTPTAMIAENDLAIGQLVEAVSHSKFWTDTVIFVLEDDAQSGSDHVDAHRMPGFVISAWTHRGIVDSTMYSTTSMLRSIELILGLQPMSQYDAAAMPLWASFADHADPTPYVARPAEVDLTARNTAVAWGARESSRMDFSAPDKADDIRLNEIVWRSVRGANSPMPAPVRAAFYKAHPKDEDDD